MRKPKTLFLSMGDPILPKDKRCQFFNSFPNLWICFPRKIKTKDIHFIIRLTLFHHTLNKGHNSSSRVKNQSIWLKIGKLKYDLIIKHILHFIYN